MAFFLFPSMADISMPQTVDSYLLCWEFWEVSPNASLKKFFFGLLLAVVPTCWVIFILPKTPGSHCCNIIFGIVPIPSMRREDAGNTVDPKSHRSNWIEREQEENWHWQSVGNWSHVAWELIRSWKLLQIKERDLNVRTHTVGGDTGYLFRGLSCAEEALSILGLLQDKSSLILSLQKKKQSSPC